MAFVGVQLAHGGFDGALEFLGGAADCLMQGGSVVADSDRLQAGETRLHQAAVIAIGRFLAQVVAEMDFDAGDLLAEAVEGIAHDRLHMVVQACLTIDGFVCVDLDLHTLAPVVGLRDHLTPSRLKWALIA